MLANDLAEAISDLRAAVVSIGRLWGKLFRLWRGWSQFSRGPELLHRADANAIGLAQGAVDRPGFGHAQLGALDHRRHIGPAGPLSHRSYKASCGNRRVPERH